MSLSRQTTMPPSKKLLAAPGPRPKFSRCRVTIALESSVSSCPLLDPFFSPIAGKLVRQVLFGNVRDIHGAKASTISPRPTVTWIALFGGFAAHRAASGAGGERALPPCPGRRKHPGRGPEQGPRRNRHLLEPG